MGIILEAIQEKIDCLYASSNEFCEVQLGYQG